ncbi:peroxisomal membrane anchor protein conserved region-domain-containing protein [Chaetomium sp. MPI-SDFR-AT-0129]|nr:peroxisomal membrane anchor protein conserved region-domain-containing protein [Chaetomium sp. MPI-SDFR-AT-0129]
MDDNGKPSEQQRLVATPNETTTESVPEASVSREEKLAQARKFLQDTKVQDTTRERKVEFLQSKGLSSSDIDELLSGEAQDGRLETETQASDEAERIEPPLAKKEDRPPIVTYPEFLTKPTRPPPLVTVNGFLNTLYAFGGLSTVVYGASKFIVEPMVNTLTEARISLHNKANDDVAKLVSKLETVVSEIPPPKPKDLKTLPAHATGDDDTASSCDDPTELFHRDIGVQTSPQLQSQPTPASNPETNKETNPTAYQTARLIRLTATLKNFNETLTDQTETLGDVHTVMDVLQQDVEKLSAAAAATDFSGGYSLYGAASRNEPEDEIRKAKENIRRVKGVLLSTRSFPTSTVR